jgi:predicted nucleic acid-binding Zn ribbon protein
MPIYEFRCQSCGHQFEELVYRRQGEPEGRTGALCAPGVNELTCPKCGEPVVRLLSSFASSKAAKTTGSSSSCGGSFS